MQPLDLNLATRPIRNNTLLWIAHSLAIVLVVGLSAWNVESYLRHRSELSNLKSDVSSIEQRMLDLNRRDSAADRKIRTHDIKQLSIQVGRANDVIQRKALSWTRLFNLLEEILPYEVRMVSIRPVFATRSRGSIRDSESMKGIPVSVEGAAKSLRAFVDFERALIEDPHFDQIEPDRTVREEGGGLVFDLRFLYFPEATAAWDEPESVESVEAEAVESEPAPAEETDEATDPTQVAAGGDGDSGQPAASASEDL
jgi:Tfp pilus assembly protein PilN